MSNLIILSPETGKIVLPVSNINATKTIKATTAVNHLCLQY